jgi:hypothetical protein
MEKEMLFEKIVEFESLVKRYNQLLSETFGITISPLLATRQGLIPHKGIIKDKDEIVHFVFHGMGCRFENNLVVDFNSSFGDFIYKGFEIKKIFEFINSCKDLNEKLKIKPFFLEALSQLESSNLIVKNGEGIDTHEYSLVNLITID